MCVYVCVCVCVCNTRSKIWTHHSKKTYFPLFLIHVTLTKHKSGTKYTQFDSQTFSFCGTSLRLIKLNYFKSQNSFQNKVEEHIMESVNYDETSMESPTRSHTCFFRLISSMEINKNLSDSLSEVY